MSRVWLCRPRGSLVTARVNIKRYYDSDANRFIRDKMPLVESFTWTDITEGEKESYFYIEKQRRHDRAWFVPKDNDWED